MPTNNRKVAQDVLLAELRGAEYRIPSMWSKPSVKAVIVDALDQNDASLEHAWLRQHHPRAKSLDLQGAKIGRRVVVEEDCRVDRPWGVTIGERSRRWRASRDSRIGPD